MAFNPSIDVNSWKLIQWSGETPKLDGQLTELMLKLSTWCSSVNRTLGQSGGGGGGGGITDAPSDGGSYARQNGAWVIVQTQKPMVTTSSALPTSGNNYGDMRITRNTGHGWVWTKGSPDAWVDSGALIPVWF